SSSTTSLPRAFRARAIASTVNAVSEVRLLASELSRTMTEGLALKGGGPPGSRPRRPMLPRRDRPGEGPDDPGDEHLVHHLVVVPLVGEVESVHQVERLAVEHADRQHVGRQLEHHLVLAVGVLDRVGVDLPRAEPPRLYRQPAILPPLLVPLEHQVAAL